MIPAIPSILGTLSGIGGASGVGASGLNLIGGALQGALSGTVPLAKALTKVNTALTPVTGAFNKTATQASQLVGTFYKFSSGIGGALNIAKGIITLPLKVGGAIGGMVTKVVNGIVGMAKKVATTVENLPVTISNFVAKPFEKVLDLFNKLQYPVLKAVDVLGKFKTSMTAIGDSVSKFTQLANPALTQRFTFASRDLTAVIGRMLIPVLEMATKLTRGAADAFNQFAIPIRTAIQSYLEPLGRIFTSLSGPLGAFGRMVGDFGRRLMQVTEPFRNLIAVFVKIGSFNFEVLFNTLSSIFRTFEGPIGSAIGWLNKLVQTFDSMVNRVIAWVRKITGIKSIAGSTIGAAVAPASFSGVEEYEKKAFAQAFSLGTASSTPEEETVDVLGNILDYIQNKMPGILADKFEQWAARKIEELKTILPSVPNLPSFGGEGGVSVDKLAGIVPGGASVAEAGRRIERGVKDARKFLFGGS